MLQNYGKMSKARECVYAQENAVDLSPESSPASPGGGSPVCTQPLDGVKAHIRDGAPIQPAPFRSTQVDNAVPASLLLVRPAALL